MGVTKNKAQLKHSADIARLRSKLKALVKKTGLTIDAFSDLAGISPSAVKKVIGSTDNDPALSSLLGILSALKIPPEDFFPKNPSKYREHPDGSWHERFQALLDVGDARRGMESYIKGCEIEFFGEVRSLDTSIAPRPEGTGEARGGRKSRRT